MSNTIKAIIAIGYFFGFAALASAEPRKVGSPTAKSGKNWAVIVGINYEGDLRLKNAEDDARQVHDLLVTCFGYQAENVRHLTGKLATKAAIEKSLQNAFLCSDAVGPDDSVVIYFSGHGYVKKGLDGKNGQAFLFPADIEMLPNGDRDISKAIDLANLLVTNLRKNCPARHKLLILDCCHAGEVFRVADGTKIADGNSVKSYDPGQLANKSFQAIAASRAWQSASDGDARAGNSPFTVALLHGLCALSRKPARDAKAGFTVNDLFEEMKVHLRDRLKSQNPEWRRLDDDQGEFHFFPVEGARFPYQELDDEAKGLLLTMVPSTFGNWWADEVPWFMPSLRLDILKDLERSKSISELIDSERIRQHVLLKSREKKYHNDYRYEHLKWFLDAEGVAGRTKAMEKVIDSLEKKTLVKKETDADYPTDVHYLAVLHQKFQHFGKAQSYYLKAIEAYQQDSNKKLQPLHALCLLDYGMLCLERLNRFDHAIEHFRGARQVLKEGTPLPFIAYTLCKEADACRRQGMFGLSDKRMKEAFHEMRKMPSYETLPLTAAVHKHTAWGYMEQCRFNEAAGEFQECVAIIQSLLESNPTNPYQCKIDLFHCQHGLAMIKRFQGDDEQACVQFRDLTRQIVETIRELDAATDIQTNHSEVRQLLCERYYNSLERQADCRLFGQCPDYAEAADDYRRALRAVAYIPEDRQDQVRMELLFRQAIALYMMPFEIEDREAADRLCVQACELEQRYRENSKNRELPDKINLVRLIALTLKEDGPSAAPENLSKAAKKLLNDLRRYQPGARTNKEDETVAKTKQSQLEELALLFPSASAILRDVEVAFPDRAPVIRRTFDRDELERLMFAHKVLLNGRQHWGLDRFEASECCDQLLTHCRAANRANRISGEVDTRFMKYLRGYYNNAFAAKAEQRLIPVKELIEIAWEATYGTIYMKPKEHAATVVLYQSGNRFYVLLDVPATNVQPAISQSFALTEEWNQQVLQEAFESGRPLPVPHEVKKALANLRTPKVLVRWRDPVTGLGFTRNSWGTLATATFKVSANGVPTFQCPFNLMAALPRECSKVEEEAGGPQTTRVFPDRLPAETISSRNAPDRTLPKK
ncbi:MAG: caspase family protein [Planctomycetes bacterium]|nr:caspase family protein [Planctomycetota bacterium]